MTIRVGGPPGLRGKQQTLRRGEEKGGGRQASDGKLGWRAPAQGLGLQRNSESAVSVSPALTPTRFLKESGWNTPVTHPHTGTMWRQMPEQRPFPQVQACKRRITQGMRGQIGSRRTAMTLCMSSKSLVGQMYVKCTYVF